MLRLQPGGAEHGLLQPLQSEDEQKTSDDDAQGGERHVMDEGGAHGGDQTD